MMLGLSEPAREHLGRRFTKKFGRSARDISVAAAAPHVRMPVLVIHDDGDTVAPIAQGLALAAAIPGATLYRTQGLGHSGALRDPAIIERVVNFLKE
jgi:pimeloyl-ACP methyl ester carboxylesterase